MLALANIVNEFYDANCAIRLSAEVVGDNVSWVDHRLANPSLHEADYILFKHFKDPNSVVLDIGANWGYSVTSMLAASCTSQIISFEPLACYVPHLTRLKERLPGRYDFRGCGLGAETARLRFVTPVVNGDVLTAYTSASEASHRSGLPHNLDWYVKDKKLENPEVTFIVSEAAVSRLDDEARGLDNICAIKIDTEGFESSVIAGGMETIRRHRPVLMLEGANRDSRVVQPLAEIGYVFAELMEDKLHLSMRASHDANGFFLHRGRVVEYLDAGLMTSE